MRAVSKFNLSNLKMFFLQPEKYPYIGSIHRRLGFLFAETLRQKTHNDLMIQQARVYFMIVYPLMTI